MVAKPMNRNIFSHILLGWFMMLGFACDNQENRTEKPATQSPVTAGEKSSENTTDAAGDGRYQHFFSVAWGCVEVKELDLQKADYQIQNFTTEAGRCPESLDVLGQKSEPLLSCEINIGSPAVVPATYVLYDKRSLDGETVSDLAQEGFRIDNFCPAVQQRDFL